MFEGTLHPEREVKPRLDVSPDDTTERMKAVLVDDEKSSLRSLSFELNAYCPEVEIIGQFQNPVSAVREIPELEPDVLFLDIEMPELNGFELLQKLPDLDFEVIFVTAYDQFAIRAFEFNAIDYLLKPVRKPKLIQAVQRVADKTQPGFGIQELQALIENIKIQSNPGGMRNIALPSSDGFNMVDINDIAYLQAESNYTWVFLVNQKKHLVAKTLKEFEGMLNFDQYYRPHKSYLVNLNQLDKYVRGQGGYLILKDGTQVPVARAQKPDLMRKLKV